MSIVITTPTGHIGSKLAELLLDEGKAITVIARNAAKVAHLAERGATVVEGALEDPAVIRKAFANAESVFWLNPPPAAPDFYEFSERIARQAAGIARELGVKRAVVQSSVGAQAGFPGNGPIGILRNVELAWQEALGDVAVIRAGFFMENLLLDVPTLVKDSAIYTAVPEGASLPFVATRDIAATAAALLTKRDWSGHITVGALGQRDFTYDEVATLASDALGKPVRAISIPVSALRDGMRGGGLPEFVVDLYGEMYDAVVAGRIVPAETRDGLAAANVALPEFLQDVLAPAVRNAVN